MYGCRPDKPASLGKPVCGNNCKSELSLWTERQNMPCVRLSHVHSQACNLMQEEEAEKPQKQWGTLQHTAQS